LSKIIQLKPLSIGVLLVLTEVLRQEQGHTRLTWPLLLVLDVLEPDPQVDEPGNQLLPTVTLFGGL